VPGKWWTQNAWQPLFTIFFDALLYGKMAGLKGTEGKKEGNIYVLVHVVGWRDHQ
jgi:hypothetical protein